MTEKKNEDPSHKPVVPPPGNVSEGSSVPIKPVIPAPKQEPELMEVHKHPHHVTHKKQWSEYLLEFAMLFLAVFLGFIAENIREGSVEKHREKEFMESLARDLATDIAAVDYGLPRKEGKNNAIDSFFMYFAENNNAAAISGKLFKTLRRTTWDNRIERNTITISQLKNAGNMRLIRNKSVADSIASYDMLWTEIELYRENYNATGTAANIYSGKLISAKPLLPLYVANQTEAIVSNIPDSLQIPINTGELNEHLNFMMTQKTVVRQQINLYNRLRARAVGLRALIKKEYDLKDE